MFSPDAVAVTGLDALGDQKGQDPAALAVRGEELGNVRVQHVLTVVVDGIRAHHVRAKPRCGYWFDMPLSQRVEHQAVNS